MLLLFSFFGRAADANLLIAVETEIFDEPEPISASMDRWGSGFDAGERQWLVSNFAVGFRLNNIELTVEQRALADLRINTEAAEFYGRLDRRERLTPGEYVPVHIDVNSFKAKALRIGYRYEMEDGFIAISGAYLHASQLMSGQLDGYFEATAQQDYDFNADVYYFYYRDPLFDRPNVVKPTGEGRSFRLSGSWSLGEHWGFDVLADDLFARIRWQDAPYTDAQAHTERKRYDEEGFAIFDPLLSGIEGYQDRYYQELDPRYRVSAAFFQGSWSTHLSGRYQFKQGFLGAGGGYRFANNLELKASLWPALEALDLELEYGRFSIGLALDDVEGNDVRFINLNLAYGY